MKTVRLLAILFPLFLGAPLGAQTLFTGFGPTYSIPLDTFGVSNRASFGGSALIESRRYCQLWTGLRLGFTQYRPKNDTVRSYYRNALSISPEARYFFAQPLELPLYVQGMVTLSGIGGTDSVSRVAVGLEGGVGYLLFYDSNCCGWFIDLHARYQRPNLFFRSEERPSLSSLLVGLSFNLAL